MYFSPIYLTLESILKHLRLGVLPLDLRNLLIKNHSVNYSCPSTRAQSMFKLQKEPADNTVKKNYASGRLKIHMELKKLKFIFNFSPLLVTLEI